MFIAVALAALTLTAAPPGDAPAPPPEETVLARTQFDAALTANGIDPATARMVACTSEYSTAPFDPAQQVISSVCFGLVGEVSPDPNAPQPILYGANTIHNADGGVITFFYKFPTPEVIGDPMPGEPTAPITFPPAGAAVPPTTAAAASEPAAGPVDPNAALVQQHLQGLNVTITEEQAACMIDIAGGDVEVVIADIGVTSDLAAQCGVDMTTMAG
jgi:hypothetical protein